MAIALARNRPAREAPAATDASVSKSPGLELLSDRLDGLSRAEILDLGAPSGPNVEYLSRYPCVVHIEDLHRSLACDERLRAPPEERDVHAILGDTFVFPRSARFDIVLGWDLFDYMEVEVVERAMHHVTRQCKAGTLLFLLAATADVIPGAPATFTIVDRNHLRRRPSSAPDQTNPRYSPRRFERMMPGFRLLHSFLLGNGIQDYLFVHE